MSQSHASSDIVWYDLRTRYLDDRIYPSLKKSIFENFRHRLKTQECLSEIYPLPIRLIGSIFTNASKIAHLFPSHSYFDNADLLKTEFENSIDECVSRTLIYVSEGNIADSNFKSIGTHIPDGMWAYPLCAIRELGFDTINGELYARLYRPSNNIRQIYSLNPKTSYWEKVTGVTKLSQMELDHSIGLREMLRHNMPDLAAIREINDMGLTVPMLNVSEYRKNNAIWNQLVIMLDELLREIKVVLSQYNIVLTHYSHNKC